MRKLFVSTALAVMALTAAVAPAGAAPKPKVNFDGQGIYVTEQDGSAVLNGSADGAPFDGTYSAVLTADDGTLPEPGLCEAATATLRLDGPRARFLQLVSDGEVCGQHLQPPYVVTQVFTGRYDIVAASKKPLVDTDGFFQVRLANDGRAGVFAIDT